MSKIIQRLLQAMGLAKNADERWVESQLSGRQIRVTERGGLIDESAPGNKRTLDDDRTLAQQIESARSHLADLEQLAASATCAEVGHRWVSIGGKPCGCHDGIDCCSLAVHECSVCNACDYGDNADSQKIIEQCSFNTGQ